MMSKIDIQLFQASLHAINAELKKIDVNNIPQKVFDELSAMEQVIKRNLQNC